AGALHLRKLLPLLLGLDDDVVVTGVGLEADDLGVVGSPEKDDLVALIGELLGEALRPEHERARRVDALQSALLDLGAYVRRDAVRADDDDPLGGIGGGLDDLHAGLLRALTNVWVCHALAEVVDGICC